MSKAMHFEQAGVPIEILMVEDNPGDVLLTREALHDARIANNLTVVEDGSKALAALRREGEYANLVPPDIIFLDLNLPKQNGLEVLSQIKADERLRRTPVVIITSSSADEDIVKSYSLHANCYITKPANFEQFIKVVRSIENFWFSVVKLVPKSD